MKWTNLFDNHSFTITNHILGIFDQFGTPLNSFIGRSLEMSQSSLQTIIISLYFWCCYNLCFLFLVVLMICNSFEAPSVSSNSVSLHSLYFLVHLSAMDSVIKISWPCWRSTKKRWRQGRCMAERNWQVQEVKETDTSYAKMPHTL